MSKYTFCKLTTSSASTNYQNERAPISSESIDAITEFTVPTAGSLPTGIAAGPDGALWFTEHGGNKIGRIAVEVPLVPRAPISRVPTRRPVRSR